MKGDNMNIRQILLEQSERTRITAWRLDGVKTSIVLPVSILRPTRAWCYERGYRMRDLILAIEKDKPEQMTLSEAVRTVFAYIAAHRDEVL